MSFVLLCQEMENQNENKLIDQLIASLCVFYGVPVVQPLTWRPAKFTQTFHLKTGFTWPFGFHLETGFSIWILDLPFRDWIYHLETGFTWPDASRGTCSTAPPCTSLPGKTCVCCKTWLPSYFML